MPNVSVDSCDLLQRLDYDIAVLQEKVLTAAQKWHPYGSYSEATRKWPSIAPVMSSNGQMDLNIHFNMVLMERRLQQAARMTPTRQAKYWIATSADLWPKCAQEDINFVDYEKWIDGKLALAATGEAGPQQCCVIC
eukprot:NODE_4565_length_771_cov_59.788820_g4542_i0.p1 GENE.NODE_4565_length_771_cov_59.788820_g4542_i0~~NODE_4565_length_771_cov_59.788820_g4542_i0.p1  ORF type:complete len:136 (-),score=10.19 NODE_4565_length_771_cov_59.788820_g4542_i0:168-575(-)